MREKLSCQHIRGSGLEIGGLHYPLPVAPDVKVAYIDRLPLETLKVQNPSLNITNEVIVDSAETLATMPNGSQDFVIANHVLEHCENPLLALQNWRRVLKPGGIAFVALPIKDYTFDVARAVTPFEHLVKDYLDGPDWSLRDHYVDWYSNSKLEGLTGDKLKEMVDLATAKRSNIHFHVWDLPAIQHLAQLGGLMTNFKAYEVHHNGSEAIVLLFT